MGYYEGRVQISLFNGTGDVPPSTAFPVFLKDYFLEDPGFRAHDREYVATRFADEVRSGIEKMSDEDWDRIFTSVVEKFLEED